MNQHPYARYSNSNEYQYPQQYEQEQEYQQGYQGYAPVPHQGQGPPVTHSQPSNPFLAAPGTNQTHRAPPRRSRKKTPAQASPVVPQPGTVAAPVMPATPADDKLEWVLVSKGTSAPSLPASTEAPAPEPEQTVNAGLVRAQEELDWAQWIIEASMCCLVEPRREFPIDQFGILEAYMPAERIDVVAAITTMTSIVLSRLRFFQVYGLPDKIENRLLGKAKYAHLNKDGVLTGFMNMAHLSPSAQNLRLEAYKTGIQGVVRGFLTQFSGHQTFYRSPEGVVKMGAPLTILQKHLTRGLCFIKHCRENYFILDAMTAMTGKEPTGIAELAVKFYDEVKGPLENRILVLKALGIHMKDLNAAAAYLVTASDPLPCPTNQDFEDWTGIKSQTGANRGRERTRAPVPAEPDPP